MKFVLVGDDFPAVQTLDILLKAHGGEVTAVFTNTEASSAGMLVQRAKARRIPVYPAKTLRDTAGAEKLITLGFDWLINVNSTVILPDAVIRSARAGALNMHPGLLPEYAGLHTHQWAILNGEKTFGATIHQIAERVDTGEIVCRVEVPIKDDDTGLSLFMRCIRSGTDALGDVLEQLLAGKSLDTYPQDLSRRKLYRLKDLPSGLINWNDDASYIERLVRAGNYEPLSSPSFTPHFRLPGGQEVQLLECSVISGNDDPTLARDSRPGSVMHVAGSKLPVVACGGGGGLALHKARSYTPREAILAGDELPDVLPAGITLP